ncbi:MAG TPA: hypothetical protein DCE43_04795 [Planctomycetaceae bacterium]|nr:hypothetical protein [Planctomycetaceae bacterium]HCK54202.1 hypothetical protein [Planctomycetaceae bacterium]|tara:strand:- start:55 stop:561 length:507 start_codon:yes stop_codon:yes gene_type:complete
MSEAGVVTRRACLVRYGRPGWVALFTSEDGGEFRRGDQVVVQTERGEELGELLSSVASRLVDDVSPAGQVLRLASVEDQAGVPVELDDLIEAIRQRNSALEPVDVEMLVDGRTVVVYCLGEVGEESERIAVGLSKDTGHDVRLSPMFDPESGGCGGGGCGEGGCGSNH